jgi:hypothetical protein
MKKLIYISLAVLLAACDKREALILTVNDAPTLSLNDISGPVSLKDSIKLSLKNSQKYYEVKLQATDKNNNLSALKWEWLSGTGTVLQDGNLLPTSSILLPTDGLLNLRFAPGNTGLNRIVVTATDQFDVSAAFIIELTGFVNLAPVGKLALIPKRQYDELDYALDASASFDRDAKYGGQIARYIYKIGNENTIFIDQPIYRHVFEEKKQYFISLQVQDNDGEYSTVFSGNFDIR